MSVKRRSHTTTVEYDVIDEAVMPSLLGPDAKMLPFQARVEFFDGELVQVIVFGYQILLSGKPGKSTAAMRLEPDDLIDNAPEWVRKLAISATVGGKA
jgi:hypothetical protein